MPRLGVDQLHQVNVYEASELVPDLSHESTGPEPQGLMQVQACGIVAGDSGGAVESTAGAEVFRQLWKYSGKAAISSIEPLAQALWK